MVSQGERSAGSTLRVWATALPGALVCWPHRYPVRGVLGLHRAIHALTWILRVQDF